MYLKRNDLVIVISGASKNETGRVIRIDTETDRVWVQGTASIESMARVKPCACITPRRAEKHRCHT